jgi:hypothetical protein
MREIIFTLISGPAALIFWRSNLSPASALGDDPNKNTENKTAKERYDEDVNSDWLRGIRLLLTVS